MPFYYGLSAKPSISKRTSKYLSNSIAFKFCGFLKLSLIVICHATHKTNAKILTIIMPYILSEEIAETTYNHILNPLFLSKMCTNEL